MNGTAQAVLVVAFALAVGLLRAFTATPPPPRRLPLREVIWMHELDRQVELSRATARDRVRAQLPAGPPAARSGGVTVDEWRQAVLGLDQARRDRYVIEQAFDEARDKAELGLRP